MWGICDVCTLALTVAKTSSHCDHSAISVPARSLLLFDLAWQDGNISGPRGRGALEEMVAYPTAKTLLFENTRYSKNCPYKIRQIQRDNVPKEIRQIVLHVQQCRFRQIVFRQILPNPEIEVFVPFQLKWDKNSSCTLQLQILKLLFLD